MELLLLPGVLLCLWMASLWLLRSWRYCWAFLAVNLVLLAAYMYLTIQVLHFGHDEYGLGRLVATAGALAAHTVLGLGFALAWRWRQHRKA